jgi:hypothetical protein
MAGYMAEWMRDQLLNQAAGAETMRLELHTATRTQEIPSESSSGYARGGVVEGGTWIPQAMWERCLQPHAVVVWDASVLYLESYWDDEDDETTSRDTMPCYSSNGARWSDLMSAIDELID